jgi:hypothetical protein
MIPKRVYVLVGVLIILSSIAVSQDRTSAKLELDGKIPPNIHEAHARMFNKNLPINFLERNIKSAKAGRDIGIVEGPGTPFFPDPPVSLEDQVSYRICSADAIAVIALGESESSLSSAKDWVFTDSLAKIVLAVKDDPRHRFSLDQIIVIGHPGGEIKLPEGNKVTVEVGPRMKKGNVYLVFLKYVPSSNQFIATGNIFSVDGSTIQSLGPGADPFDSAFSEAYVIPGLLELAAKTTCGKR